jgi:hypothetical protein
MLSKISSYMPSFFPLKLASPKQMLSNLQRCALPAIALVAMSYAKLDVYAGPGAYAACLAGCMAICVGATMGGFAPACGAACAQYCAPSLIAPTP